MRMFVLAPILLVCTIVLSIFVAKISNLITVTYDSFDADETEAFVRHFDQNLVLDNNPNHLLWFIQISDLHLSIFHDQDRISDLRKFCNITINAIQPTVVLASGDLADGKAQNHMGSDQYIQEWEYYKDILENSKVLEKTIWLDIRGNHDNFNVPGVLSEKSFYHRYSIQGRKHLHSYMYTITKGTAKYSFIGVDACHEPGPRRPFNFIGSITDEQFSLLEQLEIDSRASNGTIWFGHYPTSCIISPKQGIRQLMRNGVAYLCGHLHTLGGLVPKMYTLQQSGILELELGDWKDNRIYRVAAFDHGLFTFTDVLHNTWPVMLITNPKHALYTSPKKEPVEMIKRSTHIRFGNLENHHSITLAIQILIFSPHNIVNARVKIDSETDWFDCVNAGGPLFVTRWNPAKYSSGIHFIHVHAKDLRGNFVEVSQPFSLDGSTMSFELLPRIVLMTDATQVFQLAFAALVVLSVLPLVGLRMLHILVKQKRLKMLVYRDVWHINLIRRMWVLSTVNKLLLPLVIYPVYLVFGPWFIGEVIENHIGASFAWGILINGKLLPERFTYFYGTIQLFWFHIPFLLVLSYFVHCRFTTLYPDISSNFCSSHLYHHIPSALLLLLQAIFAFFFWQAYGGMAFILGPLRTWSVFMGIYLWYFSAKLRRTDLSEAHAVWRKPVRLLQNGRTSQEL